MWETSQIPKPSVTSAPNPTSATAGRVSRRISATCAGSCARSAAISRTPATTAPETKRKAPPRWKTRSHWYVDTAARRLASAPAYNRGGGRVRAPPEAPHGDDRGGQLDARPRGGARARRDEGGRGDRRRRLLRLPLRRPRRRAGAPGDARDERRRDDPPAAPAARGGDHGSRGRGARTRDDLGAGAPRSAVQAVPEPARERVRVDPRRADPGAGEARGRAERADEGAARVLAERDRVARRDRGAGRAVDRAREAVRARAAPRGRAGGACADLGGGVRVALPRGVATGDRQDDDGRGRRD